MRCRKARSLLLTFCSDELEGRQLTQMREHLAGCEGCRREAASFSSIKRASSELPAMSVSDDFNAKLLNRVGAERFKETRTKAHLPRRAPVVSWRLVTPALASAALLVFAAVSLLVPPQQLDRDGTMLSSAGNINDLYLTVQPGDNPNMISDGQKDWSLEEQLARAERFSRLSDILTDQQGFGNMYRTGTMASAHVSSRPAIPYGNTFFRVQPVIKVYQSTGSTDSEAGEKAY